MTHDPAMPKRAPRTGRKGAKMQTSVTEKNLGGRPPKPERERLQVMSLRMPPAMFEDLDAIAADRRDGSDRSSIAREFIAKGIAAWKAEQ